MAFIIALKEGSGVFLHWELYILALVYAVITSLPTYLDNNANDKQSLPSIIAEILVDFFLTTSIILILSPIILGVSGSAAWYYPIDLITRNPYLIAIAFGIYYFLQLLSSFIPYIGGYKTLHNLVYGAITIVYVLVDQRNKDIIEIDGSIIIVPTNFELLGFVLLCVVCLWLGVFLTGILISIFWRKGILYHCASWSIASIFWFIPLFVYGAWLGNKL